jgi:hypothetical protein
MTDETTEAPIIATVEAAAENVDVAVDTTAAQVKATANQLIAGASSPSVWGRISNDVTTVEHEIFVGLQHGEAAVGVLLTRLGVSRELDIAREKMAEVIHWVREHLAG